MRIYLCINIHTSKCESNWCKVCEFHRVCSAAKLGWGQWEKAWVVNSGKKQKSWYILLNPFSHCLVLTLRKVFELWKYCSCKISMCQWRNNKKKTFKTQPVEKMTSCCKHFHKGTFGSLLGHYLVNSIKRSHSHENTQPERGTQGSSTLCSF